MHSTVIGAGFAALTAVKTLYKQLNKAKVAATAQSLSSTIEVVLFYLACIKTGVILTNATDDIFGVH